MTVQLVVELGSELRNSPAQLLLTPVPSAIVCHAEHSSTDHQTKFLDQSISVGLWGLPDRMMSAGTQVE